MTARPSVLELPSIGDRTWWVQVLHHSRGTWVWTNQHERATVFPSRAAAHRFRVAEMPLFLTRSEKERLCVVDAAGPPRIVAGGTR